MPVYKMKVVATQVVERVLRVWAEDEAQARARAERFDPACKAGDYRRNPECYCEELPGGSSKQETVSLTLDTRDITPDDYSWRSDRELKEEYNELVDAVKEEHHDAKDCMVKIAKLVMVMQERGVHPF